MKCSLAILGSTGSVGTQALDVIRNNSEFFQASILVAGSNWRLIVDQAKEFRPKKVVLDNPQSAEIARKELEGVCEVVSGRAEIIHSVSEVDAVLGAMVGFTGVEPVLAALELGKPVALANKETLVAAGGLVKKAIARGKGRVIPVDSEHTSLYACLKNRNTEVNKVYITASGGPFFLNKNINLDNVTPEQALKHPKWKMGAKISIDSATMMNKGLEVIEASVLFNFKASEIGVVVHPEHLIHAIVEYKDANSLAVIYEPDMRVCIATALMELVNSSCLKTGASFLDFTTERNFSFYPPDFDRFPALRLCYEALEMGEGATAVLNAANEIAVSKFLNKMLRFSDIPKLVEKTLFCFDGQVPKNIEELMQLDSWARDQASNYKP